MRIYVCTIFTFSTRVLLHLVYDLCRHRYQNHHHQTRTDDKSTIDNHYPKKIGEV